MTQRVIHQDAGEHRLGDRRRADTHARIMATGSFHSGRRAPSVDRAARQADTRSRLERERDCDVLPGRDAAEHAAVVVRDEALRRHLVAVLASLLRNGIESGSDLNAFDCIDRHHRPGYIGVQAPIDRLAPADRHAPGDDVDARAAGISALAQLIHEVFQFFHDLAARREEGIRAHRLPRFKRNFYGTDLCKVSTDENAVALAEPLLRDRAGCHADHRLARRGAAAAARIAHAVFLPVSVVGVAGAELLRDRRIVLRALVFIADQETDRRAGGAAFVHARQDLDRVGFAPLGDVARAPGLSAIELFLYVLVGKFQTRRAAVDPAPDRRPL